MQWSSQEFSPCRRTCIPYAAHQRLYQQGLLKTVVLLLPPLRSALANVFGVCEGVVEQTGTQQRLKSLCFNFEIDQSLKKKFNFQEFR